MFFFGGVTQPTRNVFQKMKVDFGTFQICWELYGPRTNLYYFTQRHDFPKSPAVLPQEFLSRIVAESLEKFRPNWGL